MPIKSKTLSTSTSSPKHPKPTTVNSEHRRIRIPPHRYTPLRESWEDLATPIVSNLKLHVRFNPKLRQVEIKTPNSTPTPEELQNLQKANDFITAFSLGFSVEDALALLRLDDMFLESFELNDVKPFLHGDHVGRAIGRVAGQSGKTKFAIENASRTRIILAGKKVHILGAFNNIKQARGAICRLILGAPPGKIYNQMKNLSARNKNNF